MQGTEEVLVDDHRLIVALVGQAHLLAEALFLVDGVVQLGVCICQLLAVHHQLEALGQTGLGAMLLGKGRHLNGIIGDECRLDEGALAGLAEDFVYQFALAHGGVYLHAALLGHLAHLVLAHTLQVVTCLLLNGLKNGQTTEGSLEGDDLAVNLCLGLAVYGYTDAFENLLGE